MTELYCSLKITNRNVIAFLCSHLGEHWEPGAKLLYFLYLCTPPAAEGIRLTSNSHTSQRHQRAGPHLRAKVHEGSKESYCALWTSRPEPLLVSTNHSHFHLIILTSPLGNTDASQLYGQRKLHFPSILLLTTFHAGGCCGGRRGGQICRDGYRFCCVIWIVVDMHKKLWSTQRAWGYKATSHLGYKPHS